MFSCNLITRTFTCFKCIDIKRTHATEQLIRPCRSDLYSWRMTTVHRKTFNSLPARTTLAMNVIWKGAFQRKMLLEEEMRMEKIRELPNQPMTQSHWRSNYQNINAWTKMTPISCAFLYRDWLRCLIFLHNTKSKHAMLRLFLRNVLLQMDLASLEAIPKHINLHFAGLF